MKQGRPVLDTFRLDDRAVVVTGASSGLGAAIAVACAQAGADIVLAGRREARLNETAERVNDAGGRALVVPTDVTDSQGCQALADRAMSEFGRIDVLVNSAGVGAAQPASREPPDAFRGVVDVNLFGAYWAAQACGRHMTTGGAIVNIASILGITTAGLPQAAYAASKAGLIGLTRDLAQQWSGRKGIRVNAIAPGFFATEMTEEYDPGYLEAMARRTPLGRLGNADELAATLVWLVSDAASYVVGQTIVVDGGFTIA